MARKRAQTEDPHIAKEKRGVFRTLRNYFFTGILVGTPILLTGWLIWSIVSWVDARVKPLIPEPLNIERYIKYGIPGLGIVFAILAITAIGALAANFIGKAVISAGERFLLRVPLVRNVYGALKQLLETIVAQRKTSFREVALFEYPRAGLHAIAFVTSPARGELARRLSPDHIGVFVPTTPNPTSGFLLYVPRDEVQILDMSVEQGAKLIFSAGLVANDEGDDEAPVLAAVKKTDKPH